MMVKVWRAIEQVLTVTGRWATLPGLHNELEHALSLIPLELTNPTNSTAFRIIVEGTPRRLHPAVRSDIYEIGHEGLLNAFRHSRATKIEAILHFAASFFGIVIRDNGCGIAPSDLSAVHDRYFGLWRMQERAERIGARLKFLSGVASGTELQLVLPAKIAFNCQEGDFPKAWSMDSSSCKR